MMYIRRFRPISHFLSRREAYFLFRVRAFSTQNNNNLDLLLQKIQDSSSQLNKEQFATVLQQIVNLNKENGYQKLENNQIEALLRLFSNYKAEGKLDQKTQEEFVHTLLLSEVQIDKKKGQTSTERELLDRLISISTEEMRQMDLVDLVKQFQKMTKYFTTINQRINDKLFQQLKQLFLALAPINQQQIDEKTIHSFSYFLYLSTKNNKFDEEIFNFIISRLEGKTSKIELESAIMLLFTFSRIEKIAGKQKGKYLLDDKYFKNLYIDLIANSIDANTRFFTLEFKQQPLLEQMTKLTMLLLGTTFNKSLIESKLDLIIGIINRTVKYQMSLLTKYDEAIGIVSLANFLQTLSFDIHPSNKNKRFSQAMCKLNNSIYETILENIFIQMNKNIESPSNDLSILVMALKSYLYYYQTRHSIENNTPEVQIEKLIPSNEILQQIYDMIMINTLKYIDQIDQTTFLKILYEFSHKKTLTDYFIKDPKIVKYFNKIDVRDLYDKNKQDFLSLGHILYNSKIYNIVPKHVIDSYILILNKQFLKMDLTNDQELAKYKSQSDALTYKGGQAQVSVKDITGVELERYHASKIKFKLLDKQSRWPK